MLFFIPIRAQIKLHKWPVLTILIAILCIAIYVAQIQNEGRIVQIAKNYCTHKITAPELAVWGRLGQGPPIEACGDALAEIHTSPRPETLFAQL